ncbi:hypothetical protein NQ317_007839, partial [Molorchus minor]
VYDMNMFGEYVWILQDRGDVWWNGSKQCPSHHLAKAVDGIIFVSDFNEISHSEYSDVRWDNDEFENSINTTKEHISKYARQAYDAVWSIALALKEAEIYNYANPIEEYYYNRKDMVCRWAEKLGNLRFIGLSGPVKFNGADRIGNSIIRQMQGGKMTDIAIFNSVKEMLDFQCKTCGKIYWENVHIPIAQRKLKISLVTIPNLLYCIIVFISSTGITVSLLCLYFNLHFRKIKSVKLSSPKLNNVAVCGCILVYLSVILLGFHNTTIKSNAYFSELCTARVYFLSAGFSLAFGSMLAKTYRVHRLFTCFGAGVMKDKLLKDKQLITLLLIPLAVDAIILTLWIMIDPMEKQLYNLTLEISSSHRGVVYQPQVEVCSSQNTVGWYIALFSYKGIILVMGVFMAWKTRHIKVPALNDSQYIGISVYSAVFSTIIVILSSFISNYVLITYLAKAISILASTTLTLFLLFLPKLKLVFRKMECEDPVMHSMGLKIESNTRRFIFDDPKEQISRLEIQNKVYRSEIAALDKEISRLEELLMSSRKPSVSVIETPVDPYHSRVPTSVNERSSWPRAEGHVKRKRKGFSSDYKLDNNLIGERSNLFSRIRAFLGNCTSPRKTFYNHVNHRSDNLFILRKNERIIMRSTPEIYSHLRDQVKGLTKAESESYIDNCQ